MSNDGGPADVSRDSGGVVDIVVHRDVPEVGNSAARAVAAQTHRERRKTTRGEERKPLRPDLRVDDNAVHEQHRRTAHGLRLRVHHGEASHSDRLDHRAAT